MFQFLAAPGCVVATCSKKRLWMERTQANGPRLAHLTMRMTMTWQPDGRMHPSASMKFSSNFHCAAWLSTRYTNKRTQRSSATALPPLKPSTDQSETDIISSKDDGTHQFLTEIDSFIAKRVATDDDWFSSWSSWTSRSRSSYSSSSWSSRWAYERQR